MSEKSKDSPAMAFLQHAWTHNGEKMSHSWTRINDVMQRTLKTAISGGFRFDLGDFQAFRERFNSSFWLGDGEYQYSLACGRDRSHGSSHGPNPSAYQSIETWKGRKAFIVAESATAKATRIRLGVGQRFQWHLKMKTKVYVIVTSFNDKPADGASPYVVACSYKDHTRSKVEKLFKITHEDIKAYHAAIKNFAKQKTAKELAA